MGLGPDGRLTFSLDPPTATVRVWDASLCQLQATATANPHTAPLAADLRHDARLSKAFSPDRSRVALAWRDRNMGALQRPRGGGAGAGRGTAGAPPRDGDGPWDAVLVEVLAAETLRAMRTSEEL